MCVIVVIWVEWADVSLWVAVCFLAKISLHSPTCKTTFASLTQSQAISQSFRVFISFRSMRDTTFFHFSKLFFIQNYRFLYHGDQKISWWTLQVAGSQLRNPPVKFRQERWLHIWRSISIQHVQIEARLNSDPGNDSFWDKIRDVEHVDRSTHYNYGTCRSTQVKIASTDLWPQEMFTFSEMLALVESESSFGAYVCHGRPGGCTATSDLVDVTMVTALSRRRLVGSCVRPGENFLRRSTTTFERLTQSQAISQSK